MPSSFRKLDCDWAVSFAISTVIGYLEVSRESHSNWLEELLLRLPPLADFPWLSWKRSRFQWSWKMGLGEAFVNILGDERLGIFSPSRKKTLPNTIIDSPHHISLILLLILLFFP